MKTSRHELLAAAIRYRDGKCAICKMEPWPYINYRETTSRMAGRRGKHYMVCSYHELMLKYSTVLKYALKGYLSEHKEPDVRWEWSWK